MKLLIYVLLSSSKLDSITIFNTNTQFKIVKSYSEFKNTVNNRHNDYYIDKNGYNHIILSYVDPNNETYKKFDNDIDDEIFYQVKYVFSDGSIETELTNESYDKENNIIYYIKTGKMNFPNIDDFKELEDYELIYEYVLNRYIDLISEIDLNTDIDDIEKNVSNQSVLDILRTLVFDKYKFLGNIYRVTQESYINLWVQSMYSGFDNPLYCNTNPVKVIQEYELNEFKEKLTKIKLNKNSITNKDDFYLWDLPWFNNVRFYTINGYCISFKENKVNIERIKDLIIPEKINQML